MVVAHEVEDAVDEEPSELLVKLNDRVMRHVKESRRSLYERLDRPALKPLPAAPYEYADWKQVKLNIDYHASYEDHFYSAPYTLVHETLWCRATHRTVELFHQGERVASHPRSFVKYAYTTEPAHRPASHRAHLEWTPSRLIEWSGKIGPATAQVVERILAGNRHPEQGFRSCLGILRLGEQYPHARLEGAARRALALQVCSYQSLKSILQNQLDGQAPEAAPDPRPPLDHPNLRGPGYYDTGDQPAKP